MAHSGADMADSGNQRRGLLSPANTQHHRSCCLFRIEMPQLPGFHRVFWWVTAGQRVGDKPGFAGVRPGRSSPLPCWARSLGASSTSMGLMTGKRWPWKVEFRHLAGFGPWTRLLRTFTSVYKHFTFPGSRRCLNHPATSESRDECCSARGGRVRFVETGMGMITRTVAA